MLRIYYNPKCSKSRAALERLQAAGLSPEVIHYLKTPPQRAQLEALMDKLDEPATQLLREQPGAGEMDNDRIASTLLESPALLQRPIVETEDKAIVARPPERVDAFLDIGVAAP